MRAAWALELAGQALTGFALLMGVVVAIQLSDMPMSVANAASFAVGATAVALMFFALADRMRRRWIDRAAGSLIGVREDDGDADVVIVGSDADAHDAATAARPPRDWKAGDPVAEGEPATAGRR